MGKPKFSRKKYETPNHPWKEERIKAENELVKKYGLKNKREIWKAETALRKYRGQARELLAKVESDDPQTKKEISQLLMHLTRFNILPLNSTLDDVLALETEAILARRLQTLTYLKGLSNTSNQARQLISHGHIAIDGRRINVPGYKVTKDEENKIEYFADSALNDLAHPARPSGDFKSKITPTQRTQETPGIDKQKPIEPKQKTEKKEIQKEEKPVEKPKTTEEKPVVEQDKPKEEKKQEVKPEKIEETKEEKPVEKPETTEEKPKEEKKQEVKPEKIEETKEEKPVEKPETTKKEPSEEPKKEGGN
jgi:small subunit ribosomal protein S4